MYDLVVSSEEQGVPLLRILTDRGSEYCGNREYHEYELYLQVEGIEHTKTNSPQTNGICEGFQRTILNEFYQVAFRTKVYGSIEELQVDLDPWLNKYNEKRYHSGKYCYGKTPIQTFLDAIPMIREKMIGYEAAA
jgi:transposase InsO family protein